MHTEVEVEAEAVIPSNDATTTTWGDAQRWKLWCRLCAKDDAQGNISVFFKDEQQAGNGNSSSAIFSSNAASDLSLATAIGKYFWVNITREEELPKMLCTECFSLVTSLVNFSERVAKVQQMFEALRNTTPENCNTLDLHSLRLKYGLLDEEREHVMVQQPLPEVHYFESKPKINELEEKIFESDTVTTNPLEQPRIRIKIKKENIVEENRELEDDMEDDADDDNSDDAALDEQLFDGAMVSDDNTDNDEGYEFASANNIKKRVASEAASDSSSDEECLSELAKKKEANAELKALQEKDMPKKQHRRQIKTALKRKSSLEHDNEAEQKKAKDVSEQLSEGDKNSKPENNDEEGIYSCSECPRRFKRVQHYRQHMKGAHSKVAPMPEVHCTQCPRHFTTQHQLDKHAKVHLPMKLKKVIPCPFCEKRFTSNTLVQTHVKYIHMNERPFICEECGVTVRTNAALKMHMLTHTDYAPFECEVCKKGFKNQIRLKNHMETHDPNKHICDECGLQLNSRATLNRHLLVHSDEMQHKCDYCGRAFKRAKALKNHLILHTGLKPYSCDFCDRTFANGSNCRSHKKKAHPEELAALEASGGGRQYTRNIPKLEALKAVTKAADNLAPVVSKQSGCFAFGKKPKPMPIKKCHDKSQTKSNKAPSEAATTSNTQLDLSSLPQMALMGQPIASTAGGAATIAINIAAGGEPVAIGNTTSIPTIDNLYSHIMKQANINASHAAAQQSLETLQVISASGTPEPVGSNISTALTIQHIKRPPSQASSTCMEQSHTPVPTTTAAAVAAQHFYTQIVKHQMPAVAQQQLQQHQQLTPLQRDEIQAMRSPDSQASSHMTDDHSNTSAAHFYNNVRQNMPPGPYM